MVDLYGLRKAGVEIYDPLSSARRGGYGFLSSIDDGTWRTLTEPEASGFGLIVWSMAKKCSNCGDYVGQWLLPGLCNWKSITDSSELVKEDILGIFHDTIYGIPEPYGPMVGIRQLWVPERYECLHWSETGHTNLELDEVDCDGSDCYGTMVDNSLYLGLAPLMNVIPITGEAFVKWEPALKKEWATYSDVFENYDLCSCRFEGYEQDDCLVHQWEQEHGTHGWRSDELRELRYVAEATCECSVHAFERVWVEAVCSVPDFVDDKKEPELFTAWRYALERYFTAWKWLDQHAPHSQATINERNAWSTYYSRRYSPYWGPTGLDEYLQEHGLTQFAA